MHEMALAESLLGIVLDAARTHDAHGVSAVRLELGALSHVDPAAMRQCFDIVKHASVASEARLEIHSVAGEAWCMPCGKRVPLARRGAACPECGSHQLQIARGHEMRVMDIEIA